MGKKLTAGLLIGIMAIGGFAAIYFTILRKQPFDPTALIISLLTEEESGVLNWSDLVEGADPIYIGDFEEIWINVTDDAGIKQVLFEIENTNYTMVNITDVTYYNNSWTPSSIGTFNYTIYLENINNVTVTIDGSIIAEIEKWAMIVCSDSSFPSEMPPAEWMNEGHFSAGGPPGGPHPYPWAGQYYYIPWGPGASGFWDPTNGCNLPPGLPVHSGAPCANITNGAPTDYSVWTSFDFWSGLGVFPPFLITNPADIINFTVCISTIGTSAIPVPPAPLLSPNPLGGGAYLGIVYLDGAMVPIAGPTIYSTQTIVGTQPWTTVSLFSVPQIDGVGAVFFATILVLEGIGAAYFDDAQLSFIPDPSIGGTPNKDGFPAQALQAYNACKSHGYLDDHIMMMIDSGDHDVDINATDPITDDYDYYEAKYPGCYDYIDENVTRANFMFEMNSSATGSWANKITINDTVLIYMVDHGIRENATHAAFCFPRSADNVTESELNASLNAINCSKMALFVDACYSGNFIDSLDATNRIQVAASADLPAWFWTMATPNHWAGSWYFHPFWEALNNSLTIAQANNTGCNYVPWAQWNTVNAIQSPKVRDSSGLLSTWNPLL